MVLLRFLNYQLYKIICVLALMISLSGCIPAAALVVGATVGGAVIYDKRSVKTMAQDQQAENTAGSRLRYAPELQKGTHIVCATFDRVLLLTGQVETEQQRVLADRLMSNVNNISRVYNEITIGKPTSSWRRTHDAWLTTKIKMQMLTTAGLHSTQIKVVTENGTVYLMGELSLNQAELAVNVARRIDGVQKVVKVFESPK